MPPFRAIFAGHSGANRKTQRQPDTPGFGGTCSRENFGKIIANYPPAGMAPMSPLIALALLTAADPTIADAKAVLARNCVRCHRDKKLGGGVNLAAVSADSPVMTWKRIKLQIETGAMPPADEEPLSAEDKQLLLKYLNSLKAEPVPARRLSRGEYNRTLRDLLGIDTDVAGAVGLPEDNPGGGYANLAAALTLPPATLEKFLAGADAALDAIYAAAALKPYQLKDARKAALKKAYDDLLGPKPAKGDDPRALARRAVERFARLAFRRPVSAADIDRLMAPYTAAVARGEPHDRALRWPFKAVLSSPRFLYRTDQGADDHALASRLSYFIWSSMPDAELTQLADAGQLRDPAVFDAQVRRLTADAKAAALTEEFAGRWLQLDKFADARPSTEFFPTFTPKLREAMRAEVSTFFDKLRENDGSVFDLLDANYTYLNQELAKHYKIDGVSGPHMRKVELKPSAKRGGLLGMAAVLAMTSHTSRTSPTLRGKYVLDVVLGTPPPPPPPEAGQIDEEKAKGEAKSFRDVLAQHAARASCAGCHAKIDPLGFALDHYDPIGRWRESTKAQPLDTSGKLPTGETFNGPVELKRVLQGKRERFVRNIIEQMLTFASGRELVPGDAAAVEEIRREMSAGGDTVGSLIRGVAACVRDSAVAERLGGLPKNPTRLTRSSGD